MKIDNTIPQYQVPPVSKVDAVPALEAAASRSSDADSVQLSSVAEALKIGQEALQTKLGEQIAAAFESIGVDLEQHVGIDYSPEAVSDRIAGFAGSMFELYRDSRPEMSGEEAVSSFEKLYRGGVESGYGEAMDLLTELHIPESVLDVSRETKGLIDSKLDALFEQLRSPDQDMT